MYRVADRLLVRAGRMVRQVGTKSRDQSRVKTGRTRKRRNAKSWRTGNTPVDLETYKTNEKI